MWHFCGKLVNRLPLCFRHPLDALKKIGKIIRENAFKQKKKIPRLNFYSGLALIGLRTTGPWVQGIFFSYQQCRYAAKSSRPSREPYQTVSTVYFVSGYFDNGPLELRQPQESLKINKWVSCAGSKSKTNRSLPSFLSCSISFVVRLGFTFEISIKTLTKLKFDELYIQFRVSYKRKGISQ